jgi:hypothetical protein
LIKINEWISSLNEKNEIIEKQDFISEEHDKFVNVEEALAQEFEKNKILSFELSDFLRLRPRPLRLDIVQKKSSEDRATTIDTYEANHATIHSQDITILNIKVLDHLMLDCAINYWLLVLNCYMATKTTQHKLEECFLLPFDWSFFEGWS